MGVRRGVGFFSALPRRPEGTRKALMTYIYNHKLTWNGGHLRDLCHQFEWLRVLLMGSGLLHMCSQTMGRSVGPEWASIAHMAGSAVLRLNASGSFQHTISIFLLPHCFKWAEVQFPFFLSGTQTSPSPKTPSSSIPSPIALKKWHGHDTTKRISSTCTLAKSPGSGSTIAPTR